MPIIKTYTGSLADEILLTEDNSYKSGIGIRYPFGIDGRPFSSTYTTLEMAKSNIRLLLQTEVGERVMQPEVGVSLRELLFENFNENNIIVIKDRILSSIEKWIPYVDVNKIDVKYDNDTQNLSIFLSFNLKADNTIHSFLNFIRR